MKCSVDFPLGMNSRMRKDFPSPIFTVQMTGTLKEASALKKCYTFNVACFPVQILKSDKLDLAFTIAVAPQNKRKIKC